MRQKKAAMELSIGTIVIIVLAMSMLIFGLVLVRNIFAGGTDAVESINRGVINEINNMFADPNTRVAIFPVTRRIDLEQGSRGKGVALSVRNVENNDKNFQYRIAVDETFDSQTRCANFLREDINEWLDMSSGSFTLARGQSLENPELISLTLPELAPLCNIPFRVTVESDGQTYATSSFWVNVVPS